MNNYNKILFICSKESDYLQDLTYNGLIELFGKKRVCDYFRNKNYHFPFKKYPRNLGFSSIDFNWHNSFNEDFSDISLVIVGSCKPETFRYYLKIISEIPSKVPVVFIDGGDYCDIGGDMKRLNGWYLYEKAISIRPFDLIFKREYLLNMVHPKNVFPLPFSFNFRNAVAESSYKYDVSFWAVESDPIRTKALTILENKFDCKNNGTVLNQNFSKYKRKGTHYLQELAKCKIVLNFRGVGWDTLRYWEAPAMGTLMISQKPFINIPNNFLHKEEVVFCNNDLSDLEYLCQYYLINEEERIHIAKNSYNTAKKNHSTVARATYLLETIKNYLGITLFESHNE